MCFVIESYAVYHLFCNIIRKALREVTFGLCPLGKGDIFDMGGGKKGWQQLDMKI